MPKHFKQACGNFQDIGQQRLALEGRIGKNKAVLDEQQEQLAKVQQKLTDTQAQVEWSSKAYQEKVLQAQLEPTVPDAAPGLAEALARAAKG